jgi:1-acyl-sn-glycerol-3-phosphate acyltransferase
LAEALWLTAAVASFGVVVWLARHVIRRCEAENGADWGNVWLNRLDGLNRIFCRKVHRLRHAPIALPKEGGALVVCNHVSGLDPLLLFAASPRPLRFLIAREEYDRWWLRWLFKAVGCIPVERVTNPRAALYAAREQLLAGEVVALFPHGGIHLDHHPRRPLKRGVVVLARLARVPIYPLRIEGVRGQGLTIAAVLVPGRVRMKMFPPMYYKEEKADHLMERLEATLAGKAVS